MKRSNFKLRKATPDDLIILKKFEQGVVSYERPYAPNLREDPISYYDILALIQNEDAEVIVACEDEQIIGSGYALIKNSPAYKKPDQLAYLGFMYVLPEHRGKGVIGKIIDKLMAWANARNLTEFQLDVYAENESAIRAYAKRGFKPSLLKMRFNTQLTT